MVEGTQIASSLRATMATSGPFESRFLHMRQLLEESWPDISWDTTNGDRYVCRVEGAVLTFYTTTGKLLVQGKDGSAKTKIQQCIKTVLEGSEKRTLLSTSVEKMRLMEEHKHDMRTAQKSIGQLTELVHMQGRQITSLTEQVQAQAQQIQGLTSTMTQWRQEATDFRTQTEAAILQLHQRLQL